MYVYIQSQKTGWYPSPKQSNSVWLTGELWTVGFFDPQGNWHAESDHDKRESAAERVHYLNGGTIEDQLDFNVKLYTPSKK